MALEDENGDAESDFSKRYGKHELEFSESVKWANY